MIWKLVAASSLLCATVTADAAILYSNSGTMDPSWGSDYFEVPEFPYNVPLTIKFEMSRTLAPGEYLDFGREWSVEWWLLQDGDWIDYDYYHYTYDDHFTLVSGFSLPEQNTFDYHSWYQDDWDGQHFFEEKYWVTLETIWLDNQIFTPFDWTITISGAIPEPATWGLMISGFGLAGIALRRRRQEGYSITS